MKRIVLLPLLLFAAFALPVWGGGGERPFMLEQPEMPGPSGEHDSDVDQDAPPPGVISVSAGETSSLCPDATIVEQTLLLTFSTLPQMTPRVPARLEEIGASREEQRNPDSPEATSLKVNIRVGGRTITATMENNAAGRDFLSRLPLEITLNDYNNTTEKIFYPEPALTIAGVTRGCAPVPGDITIYAPWGNVAIFCKSWSRSNDLIKIGHIDGNGIEALRVRGDIQVKIERQ